MIGVLRDLVGALVLLGQAIVFGDRCVAARLLLFRDRRLGPRQPPQASGVAIGKVDRDLGPLPALGADFLGCALELLAGETIEQGRILQPTPVVAVEEVAQHDAARRLISLNADELDALVGTSEPRLGSTGGGSHWAPYRRNARALPTLPPAARDRQSRKRP